MVSASGINSSICVLLKRSFVADVPAAAYLRNTRRAAFMTFRRVAAQPQRTSAPDIGVAQRREGRLREGYA